VEDGAPSWSPDATTVYFSRFVWRTEVSSIYSVAPDGTHLLRLTHPAPTSHGHCQDGTAASPKGKIIVFTETFDCEHGSERRLKAITTGGRPVRLPFRFPVPGDSLVYDAAWSPDGKTIAYATQPLVSGAASGLFLSALSPRSIRRVGRPGAAPNFVSAPAWSP
jgi:Tol biopolymer transport system component